LSYCPEDGIKMVTVCNHGADACYQCGECGAHWEYVDGTYRSTQGSTNCDVHDACEECMEHGTLPEQAADQQLPERSN